jgi:DNA polymerase
MLKCGEAASLLGWWQLAGADALLDETPRNWLKPVEKPIIDVAEPTPAIPDTVEGLDHWIADPANLSGLTPSRVTTFGSPLSDLAIFVDMPDPEDGQRLLSGDAGRLFDRMLSAIGRNRTDVYGAALCPVRPTGGRIPPQLAQELAQIALKRVALTGAKALLLMGDATTRAFLGANLPDARGRLLTVNYEGGSVTAVATFHPRFLLKQPARKADCWRDLQRLIGAIEE